MCVMSVNVECLQQQQQLYLYPAVPYIDLHDTKKLDKYIERVQAAHNNPYLPTSGDLKSGDSLFCTTLPHPNVNSTNTPTPPPRANKLP